MQYLIIAFCLCLAVFGRPTAGQAGVAEASTAASHQYATQYDLSGLSADERDWFLTFIRGNILAEGWGRITSDILRKTSAAERENRAQELNQLGTKIGREWCRKNDVRRIDNTMLREWGGKLRRAAKNEPHRLAEVIRFIDGEVDSLIN